MSVLKLALRFYREASILSAPNPELADLLEHRIGRPCDLMVPGIDTAAFSPGFRSRTDNGGDLARAYANMDVFVFPSETDTYGNVIQEALAFALPCVVSLGGGPKYRVQEGRTGFVAGPIGSYADVVVQLYSDRQRLAKMRSSARAAAEGRSWDAVFEGVYRRHRARHYPHTTLKQNQKILFHRIFTRHTTDGKENQRCCWHLYDRNQNPPGLEVN